MSSRRLDHPANEAAKKIYEYIAPEEDRYYSNGETILNFIWIANTIAGPKPVASFPDFAMTPEIKERIEKAMRIRPGLEIVKSNSLTGEQDMYLIGTQEGIARVNNAIKFGKKSEEYFGSNINETPARETYHILLGRAFGYSDSEISNFIGTDIQSGFQRFRDAVKQEREAE